jgi:hypothetical protein
MPNHLMPGSSLAASASPTPQTFLDGAHSFLLFVAHYILLVETAGLFQSMRISGFYTLIIPAVHLACLLSSSRTSRVIRRNTLHVGIWSYAVALCFRASPEIAMGAALLPLASLAAGTHAVAHVDQKRWRLALPEGRRWMFAISSGILLLAWHALLAAELSHPGATWHFINTPMFQLC